MEVHRLEIPDELGGGWVDIRKSTGWKTRVDITGKAIAAVGEDAPALEFGIAEAIEKFLAYIVAWSLVDDDGEPVEVTREFIESDDFDGEIGGFILREADAWYAQRRLSKRRTPRAEQGD